MFLSVQPLHLHTFSTGSIFLPLSWIISISMQCVAISPSLKKFLSSVPFIYALLLQKSLKDLYIPLSPIPLIPLFLESSLIRPPTYHSTAISPLKIFSVLQITPKVNFQFLHNLTLSVSFDIFNLFSTLRTLS